MTSKARLMKDPSGPRMQAVRLRPVLDHSMAQAGSKLSSVLSAQDIMTDDAE